jgi:thymidine kinase
MNSYFNLSRSDTRPQARRVLLWGPVCSNKTTQLLIGALRIQHQGFRTLILNPACNTRDEPGLVTSHDGLSSIAEQFDSLAGVLVLIEQRQPEAVFLEEAQFVPFLGELLTILEQRGLHVFMSALNMDFEGNPFPVIRDVLHTCDVIQMFSVCFRCQHPLATHSYKVSSEKAGPNNVLIGGQEAFRPICRQCFRTTTTQTINGL